MRTISTVFKRSSIFLWLMAALALAPALLYAYLGQFSRLQADDYCAVARGLEMGVWDYMTYKIHTLGGGGHVNWFLKGALAPLDIMAVRIMPALIVILWLFGLFWLIDEGLAHLKISHSRRPLAIAIAALGVAGAISSSPLPQSFYWFAASTRYILPLPLLVIYLALTVRLAKRTRLPAWGLMAGAALYFITALASEMFMVFQMSFLTGCLLMSLAWRRRAYARILGVGWLATLVGLMLQLNAPGVAVRAAWMEERYGRPDRSLLTVLSKTFEETLKALGHPQIFVGFVLLMAVGLLVMLFACRPQKTLKTSKPVELVPSAWWLGLIFQLLFAPILWLHTSNIPQFLGRFSLRYMVVIVLNLAFILGFAVLLWRRGRINVYLQKHERGLLILCGGMLLIFAALFALSQLTSYYLSASWLLMTALMFLGLLCWQLSSMLPGAETRKIGLLALCSLGIGLACVAAIVGVAVFGRGYAMTRILAPGNSLLTLSGLVWGFFLGWLVKHLPSQYDQVWINWLKLASLAAMLIIALGIVLDQVTLYPDFRRYAQEWDARHFDIIAQRDRGQKTIKTAPLSYDLAEEYTRVATIARDLGNECARLYYGVDSIVVER